MIQLEHAGDMSAKVVLNPDKILGDPVRKRVKWGDTVAFDHFNLTPWTGRPMYESWNA